MTDQPGEPAPLEPAPDTPAPPLFQADPPPTRPRRPDPWAHRRGEPRVFAFLWTLFLFAATAATFLTALSTGQTGPDVMRPATRALFAIVAGGIVVLWPMVRLSQIPDRHPLSGCIQDLVVILVPVQAVVWPQWFGWLGRWPLAVVASVSCLLVAWGFLSGGFLALAQVERQRRRPRPGPTEAWWMLLILLVGLGGAAAALAPATTGSAGPADFRPQWMLSPVTAIYELTRDRAYTGASAAVGPGHWLAIAAVLAASLPAWALAALRSRGMKPPGGLH